MKVENITKEMVQRWVDKSLDDKPKVISIKCDIKNNSVEVRLVGKIKPTNIKFSFT